MLVARLCRREYRRVHDSQLLISQLRGLVEMRREISSALWTQGFERGLVDPRQLVRAMCAHHRQGIAFNPGVTDGL